MKETPAGKLAAPEPLAWWQWHRRLYNWVVHWADTRYGVPALIILAVTEPIIVPIPVDVLVVGLSLGKPKRAIRYGLTASLFSVLGGALAFLLGMAIGGERVQQFFGLVGLGDRAAQALQLYADYRFWAISISALTPVPYMLFSWLGGMSEVSIWTFIGISMVFRTMRFTGEAALFYFFGERAKVLIERYFNIATVVVIVLLALLAFAMRQVRELFGG